MDDRHHHHPHGNGKPYPDSPVDYGRGPPSHHPSVVSGPPPPGARTTSITLNTDPVPGATVTEINLNLGYFKTLPGILKLVQLIIGIICMACAAPATGLADRFRFGIGHNHFFLAVVVICFIITLLWTFFYFLQMADSVRSTLPCSWLKLEFVYTAVATVFYLLGFIVILSGFGYCAGFGWCDARIAAGVFAIFNTVAYGLGAYILRNDYNATPPELQ